MEPGDVKAKPGEGRRAVKMAPNVTAGSWFVIDPANGGYYTDDAHVADWVDVPLPESVEEVEPEPEPVPTPPLPDPETPTE